MNRRGSPVSRRRTRVVVPVSLQVDARAVLSNLDASDLAELGLTRLAGDSNGRTFVSKLQTAIARDNTTEFFQVVTKYVMARYGVMLFTDRMPCHG